MTFDQLSKTISPDEITAQQNANIQLNQIFNLAQSVEQAGFPLEANVSIYSQRLSDKKILIDTGNTELLLPPASTQKVITALAAKLWLPDTFRYETQLIQKDKNLILAFSGDPNLTSADLKTLFSQYKAKQGDRIQGDILLDQSAFDGIEQPVAVPWDNLGICYSAPSTALSLDQNCFEGALYRNKTGKTRLFVPKHFPVSIKNESTVVDPNNKPALELCQLNLKASMDNNYLLQGCVAQSPKLIPLKFALQDTGQYAQVMIKHILRQLGIKLQGQIIVMPTEQKISPYHPKQVIARHLSAPLPYLLQTMLVKSDNLIANNLLKTIGSTWYQTAGNFSNGSSAIKAILKEKAGIDLSRAQLADGSGLSRNNKVSARQMADILTYIWQQDANLQLIELLPISGKTGTLAYRKSMQAIEIKDKIAAKSGFITGSYNMMGYVLDKQRKPYAIFVQFINNYFDPSVPEETEEKQPSPIWHFEQNLYQNLVLSAAQ